MYTSDKRIIKLIELLIFQRKISFVKDFCNEIGILEQSVSKIKKGLNHFTVIHIETICKIYNVNANWIYGLDDKVFNTLESIKVKDF
jgi:DNA-binding Xre family transcriptional regulator